MLRACLPRRRATISPHFSILQSGFSCRWARRREIIDGRLMAGRLIRRHKHDMQQARRALPENAAYRSRKRAMMLARYGPFVKLLSSLYIESCRRPVCAGHDARPLFPKYAIFFAICLLRHAFPSTRKCRPPRGERCRKIHAARIDDATMTFHMLTISILFSSPRLRQAIAAR